MGRRVTALLLSVMTLSACATTATTSQPSVVVYPAKGQTAQLQQTDTQACLTWAKEQSGYDPMTETAKGAGIGALMGAVAGVATGAAIGAASGNVGKGAAVGAVVGGVGGAATGGGYTYVKSREGYDKAFSACMEGRGYTVK